MNTKTDFRNIFCHLFVVLVVGLLVGLLISLLPGAAGRATSPITVNSTLDAVNNDGFCTLREAIIAANKDKSSGRLAGECAAGSGSDTINLPSGVYKLTRTDSGNEDAASTGDLDILGNLTISGAGAGTTIINTTTGFSDRVFQVLSGTVTISGVTISGGNDIGNGGGISNASSLTLIDSLVSGNRVTGLGGGIFNAPGASLTVRRSTISGNSAGSGGAGIANGGGTLSVFNTTLSGNTSPASGGGLSNSGSLSMNNLTITLNNASSGGGLANASGGTVNIQNSILAGNTAAASPDCSGALNSQGYNLIQDTADCTIGGATSSNLTGVAAGLGPLQPNGGSTPTHALLVTSPAIDAGNPALPGSGGSACEAVDQRGVARPQGLACDMGAFELENPPQTGPIYTVNIADDQDFGFCGILHCSLREAIQAANRHPNGSAPDEIHFGLPGSAPFRVQPLSSLPAITEAVKIDGSTQPGGSVEINGNSAGAGANGLTISAGNITVSGLTIQGFSGSGIVISSGGQNRIQGNTITANGADGVLVSSGSGNTIQNNSIYANGLLGIDLGGDGLTANDPGDIDSGSNDLQNFPILSRVIPGSGSTVIEGRLSSHASAAYQLQFFTNTACNPSTYGEGKTLLGMASVTADANGDAYFQITLATTVPQDTFVTANATDPSGNTSEFSQCTISGPGNDSWPKAYPLTLAPTIPGVEGASITQYVDKLGQSRWFKFSVQPGNRVIVTLTGLPANYDLTLYKDISAAFSSLDSTQDLVRLGAEFAPDAVAPDAFAPDAFAPDAFAPDAFAPDAFAPDAFAPDAFAPDAFAPDAFAPDAFAPDAFAPDAFAPDAFAPDAFAPDAFAPDAFAPDAFAPDAFASAQTRSLLAVSAFDGTASEGIAVNTWDNGGDFYVRVRGRNGAFSLASTFHLNVIQLSGACNAVTPNLPATTLGATGSSYHTLILTDPGRMAGSDSDKNLMLAKLASLAARPDVAGAVVNVSQDARVAAANAQADTNPECPYAKNLVAQAIQGIVASYRATNPLEYVVLIGNDQAIPFFRHPDQALIGSEKNFVPPVRDTSPSQASLKLGYVLSQDDYGASLYIDYKDNPLPIPDLPVGRLVETPSEVMRMIDAYLGTNGGILPAPASLLVTGYDFLTDDALAVQTELQSGSGLQADTLIAPRNLSPADPGAWNANQLKTLLLGQRHDLIFLAGHFSASSALAADFSTRLQSTDVLSSSVDLTNALIFSAGCHAGYNIVDTAAIPSVTRQPDWPEAFANKGATLIAGTGYQYGDTDFIKYSEQIYLNFSKQLRTGTGPVSIGKALVAAKQAYLSDNPQLRAIDEKAVLEATLFGFPMMKINMPQGRGDLPVASSIVSGTNSFSQNPGYQLGLAYADISLTTPVTPTNVPLKDLSSGSPVNATYLSGKDGIASGPAEPTLPRAIYNVFVPGNVLRGVGFRGGDYSDTSDVLPLTGAATTELRGLHAPFQSKVFFPIRPWNVNYFAALADPNSAYTPLILLPAQYRSSAPGSSLTIQRAFSALGFRLYYSNNLNTYANGSVPGLSAPPSISQISSSLGSGSVGFRVSVVGNPAAGIQEVWVTYTALNGPYAGRWQSLDLVQNPADSRLWEGNLPLNGTAPTDIRYMVQAVNGVGLVSMETNLGDYFIPGLNPSPNTPTSLSLVTPSASAAYGTSVPVTAMLSSMGAPLPGQIVNFSLGGQSRQAVTDSNGQATASVPVLALPGSHTLQADFAGFGDYQPSAATSDLTITKQSTSLTLQPQPSTVQYNDPTPLVATLTDAAGRRLGEQTVIFILNGPSGTYVEPVITDYAGRAPLDALPLSAGSYSVAAYFRGVIPLPGQTLTLVDDRYDPSSANGAININPESASLVYTGDTLIQVGSPLHLSATVTQDADGNLGDLSLAKVQFDILDQSGTVLATTTSPVSSSGIASATISNPAAGAYQVVSTVTGGYFASSSVTVQLVVNAPPTTSGATPSSMYVWSPNNDLVPVNILGVVDPDGDLVTITITSIFQDEPVGTGPASPDGAGIGTDTPLVRAERDGNGDGRVYHIFFTATDGRGGINTGVMLVGVSDNQGHGLQPIDGGALYDSTIPQ